MCRRFLLLALCALAVALPRNTRSLESETESEVQELTNTTTTTTSTTTDKPESKVISIESSAEFQTRPSQRSLESETEPEVQELTSTTTTTTSTTSTTSTTTTTTEKPESKVISIESSADFQTRLSQVGDKLVVVYSMTSWCGHSRRVRPTVEEIAADNTEKLVVFMVNVDQAENSPGVSWKYEVTNIGKVPTFFFVKNGSMLENYSGSGSKKLRNTVAKYIAK